MAEAVVRRGGRPLLLRRQGETGELGGEVGEVDGSWSVRLLDVLVLLVSILRGGVALRMRGSALMAGLLLLLRGRRPRRVGGRIEDLVVHGSLQSGIQHGILAESKCEGTRADVRGRRRRGWSERGRTRTPAPDTVEVASARIDVSIQMQDL